MTEEYRTMPEIYEEMKKLATSTDPERAHGEADDLLCEALERLGRKTLVDLFHQVPKWYA